MGSWLVSVCALAALAGCAEAQGMPAHTTAAAVVNERDVPDLRPVVRLRIASGSALRQEAFNVVRSTLFEQGFVASGFPETYDADLLIDTRWNEQGRRELTLSGRVGKRIMEPLAIEIGSRGGFDEDKLVDLCIRWQGRFHRRPQVDRHFLGYVDDLAPQ